MWVGQVVEEKESGKKNVGFVVKIECNKRTWKGEVSIACSDPKDNVKSHPIIIRG